MPETHSQRRSVLVVGVIVAATIAAHYLGILQPVERLTLRFLAVVGRSSMQLVRTTLVGIAGDNASNRTAHDLALRVTDLMVQNVRLQEELITLRQSMDQQAFSSERRFRSVQTRIFARSPDPSSSYVVVDRGSRDGIGAGLPAVIGDGVVVGKVISSTDDTSQILLSVDNRSSFAGVSASDAAAQGVVTGIQGLSLTMGLIPQSETVNARDIVVTSGVDGNVPKGLVLGEIDRVEKQQGALFQTATLRTPYVISDLNVITIILGETR